MRSSFTSRFMCTLSRTFWHAMVAIWLAICFIFTGTYGTPESAEYFQITATKESVMKFLGLTVVVQTSDRDNRARQRGTFNSPGVPGSSGNTLGVLYDLITDSFGETLMSRVTNSLLNR